MARIRFPVKLRLLGDAVLTFRGINFAVSSESQEPHHLQQIDDKVVRFYSEGELHVESRSHFHIAQR